MPTERALVFLLRGINVGGHGKLPMADLRDIARDLGLRDPATYIQSGNLVARTDLAAADAARALEEAIAARTEVSTRVAARTLAELERIFADNPFAARTDDEKQLHASFLFEGDAEALAALEGLAERLAPDEIALGDGVAWLYAPNGLGRSNLGKLPKRHSGTTRNWRTVQRLITMAREAAG
ncbi:MAG: DUF1697 domain-containing protein [Myxococcota bacterium]